MKGVNLIEDYLKLYEEFVRTAWACRKSGYDDLADIYAWKATYSLSFVAKLQKRWIYDK